MYELVFANSFGRSQFTGYQREHTNLESLALEILRVSELPGLNIAAHEPQVHNENGKLITDFPRAHRELRVIAKHGPADRNGTRTVIGHERWELTFIGLQEISRSRVG